MILLKYYIHYAYLNTLAWVLLKFKGSKATLIKLHHKIYTLKAMQRNYEEYNRALKLYLQTGSPAYERLYKKHEEAYNKHKKHYYGTK